MKSPTNSLEFFQVDAFADKPFAGNPAAVFVLDQAADESWMKLVAREMNLAETAFLVPRGEAQFDLRWFTPAVEVDLCGHATLASAHILWQTNKIARSQTPRFHTRSGELRASLIGDLIELDFPATENIEPAGTDAQALRSILSESLFVTPRSIRRCKFDVLVEVDSEKILREIAPNFSLLKNCDAARGVIVTTRAEKGSQFDFVSRFFAPRAGVDEDPVTGSAHCALAPYWSQKLGKKQMLAYQASTRGGTVRVTLKDDRVLLAGKAITIFRGEMTVDADD